MDTNVDPVEVRSFSAKRTLGRAALGSAGLLSILFLAHSVLGHPASDETFASIVTCTEAGIFLDASFETGWYHAGDSGEVSKTNNRRLNSCWHQQ